MLSALLENDPLLPDVWGEGALWAFSGLDGATNSASGFVASLTAEAVGLLWHTPQRRRLCIEGLGSVHPRLVLGDVLGCACSSGELLLAFDSWHTVVGWLPEGARVDLQALDGADCTASEGEWISVDGQGRDALVALQRGQSCALAYGRGVAEARARAEQGLTCDVLAVARQRLAFGHTVRSAAAMHLADPERARLLAKCIAVIKVNALAPEGAIGSLWSTPDRVPHRAMWLWDSVLHSLAMNRLAPDVAWQYLQAVLETQRPDGMIPHRADVDGSVSAITQPPLLAWGVWENYNVRGDRAALAYALPRLERYLEWDLAQRDRNANGLLEWYIEGDPRCRSGESGMDNSPRFDAALALDAVDFSVFAAHDMGYLARIAAELGAVERAAAWRARAERLAELVHTRLWHEGDGFYYDRELAGAWSQVPASSGFLPLLLDGLPPERLPRVLAALDDPQRFGTAFPVPSVARSHPAWSTDMWRGATWLNTNYLIILGLRRQGLAEEAARLAAVSIAAVAKYWRECGVLFEFYDADDRVPPWACDRKGPRRAPYDLRAKMDSIRDYHWTAALVASLLLEEG